MITDERLAEIVGAGMPCVPIEPWEVAHVVQELRSLRAQGGVRVGKDGDTELHIDELRLRAFQTNADADKEAYLWACSKWFQDRHFRRMALSSPSPDPVSDEWKPIEEVWADPEVPIWVHERDKSEPKTRHIGEVLVFGRKWEGSWDESPYYKDRPGAFSGEPDVFIATTYEGAPCWLVPSAGPSDYDEYVQPTHYKLKPKPPAAKGGQ